MTSQQTNFSPPCLGDRIVLKGNRLSRRQRAKKACTHCRARKVRCDINIHGWPCTVCREDSSECKIIARKRVVHRKKATPSPEQSSQLDQNSMLSWRDDHELTRGPRDEISILKDFEAKLASMSVLSTHKTHIALSPSDALQLEEDTYTELHASKEHLHNSQDCTQSLCNRVCNDWPCSKYSDTERDTPILSPLDRDRTYDHESPYSEKEPGCCVSEPDQYMPLEEITSWQESGIWSILHGGWPRLD